MAVLEKVLSKGFVEMTEDELYSVNGGKWFGREKDDEATPIRIPERKTSDKDERDAYKAPKTEGSIGCDVSYETDIEGNTKSGFSIKVKIRY